MEQVQIDMFNGLCCGSTGQCIAPSIPPGDIDMILDAHSGLRIGSVNLNGTGPFSISNVVWTDHILFTTVTCEIFGNVLYIYGNNPFPSTVDGTDITFTITNPCGSLNYVGFLLN